MNTQRQIFLIVVLLFISVAGCAAYTAIDLPIRAERQADFFQAESIERGALLYANNCRTCHGIRGEGGVGLTLNKAAFRNQEPLALSQNQDLIRRTLICGRAGTLMPAWLDSNGGSLTANQIEHLVRLLTAPLEGETFDANGNPTNHGWLAAVEFAHNLNHESSASVTGDTLPLIAAAHGIGANEVEGAILIAELNGLTYAVDGSGNFYLPYSGDEEALMLNPSADTIATGLLPGQTLRLPEGASYRVSAGDTLGSIAERHGITPSQIRSLNLLLLSIVGDIADDTPLTGERKLLLPDGTSYTAQAGDTLVSIAEAHDIPVLALAEDNGLAEDAAIAEGTELTLRDGTGYIVQFGDTVLSIASAHGLSESTLRSLNELGAGEDVSTEVWIALPPINAYVVAGADLTQVASGFGNVTAASLGEANGLAADAVVPIGKSLHFPADAWGAAPSDEINPGTACVEHTVSTSAFNTISGADPIVIDEPNAVSTDVLILANDNDWTVVADGVAGEPNRTGVKVAVGTTVTFENVVGLHNIEIDGQQQGDDFEGVGVTRTFTFDAPGEYRITCSYHPDMLAVVFVTE
ncbi:MAG: LysM peptidoglycan-binding domain-containing protein [Chloroflexota bacterium]|nr:LysM peptidoglycan-binding domain-containing protein [Chloroflexota bacterium]